MAGRAIIIGATGQIGRATVPTLVDDGWQVTAIQRNPDAVPADWFDRGVIVASADRSDSDQLRAAMADGADVVVDVVPYDGRDARQLIEVSGDIGSIVAISTAGVYVDAAGRTFPGTPDAVPEFPVPIREDQPTVAPAPDAYHTAKVELEQTLLAESPVPVTVIRPGATHGPGSSSPREWWPLMRALDRRPAIPLAFGGRSRFHTSSARNLAGLIRVAAATPGTRVLNGADPTAPDARALIEAVCAAADHQPEIVTYDGWPPDSKAGSSPWSIPMPVVLDMSAAERELGYRPVTTYADAVLDTCAWLREITYGRPWQEALPEIPRLYGARFGDYEAEDELLDRLAC
jgi:nucleoside-diphosphate-sugar epimerase